jgi:hypothetical protein
MRATTHEVRFRNDSLAIPTDGQIDGRLSRLGSALASRERDTARAAVARPRVGDGRGAAGGCRGATGRNRQARPPPTSRGRRRQMIMPYMFQPLPIRVRGANGAEALPVPR